MELALARNWWALALRGAIAVVFGLLTFAMPGMTLQILLLLFGAYALVDGIFTILAAVREAQAHHRWGVLLLEGIAGILAGVLTFAWPGITALVLLYLIAAWAIFTGIFEIAAAIKLRKVITGEWFLALSGVASVLFGLLLFLAPGPGALVVVWWIGAYALVFGILMIALAFRLRSWARTANPSAGVLRHA